MKFNSIKIEKYNPNIMMRKKKWNLKFQQKKFKRQVFFIQIFNYYIYRKKNKKLVDILEENAEEEN